MSDFLHVAVLMGGETSEREISLKTGRAVAGALRQAGHEVAEIELGDPLHLIGTSALQHADVVFPALHGGAGEDGRIQALLELRGKPYVGSAPGPSALAMDKGWTKRIARDLGLRTPEWVELDPEADEAELWGRAEELGFPLVLKPIDEGSAVGVEICPEASALREAIGRNPSRSGRWMLERYVAGRELTLPILLDRPTPSIEIRPHQGFYDYQNKYTPGRTEYFCPAALEDTQAEQLAAQGMRLYRALHLRDMARIDFRMDPAGVAFLLEVNTIPGMTATSLLPMGAAALGIDFVSMCDRLCRVAADRAGRSR
jgi:D-alanine-D-alanine ligase